LHGKESSSGDPGAEARAQEHDRSLAERLAEVEKAHLEGRLWELVQDTPPVRQQLRTWFKTS
jgi:hypothetical protein